MAAWRSELPLRAAARSAVSSQPAAATVSESVPVFRRSLSVTALHMKRGLEPGCLCLMYSVLQQTLAALQGPLAWLHFLRAAFRAPPALSFRFSSLVSQVSNPHRMQSRDSACPLLTSYSFIIHKCFPLINLLYF